MTSQGHGTWNQGWWSAAHHQPSPNFGPRPAHACIDLLVLHSISLPPGEYGTGCIDRLFANTLDFDAHPYFQQIRGLEVSAHFLVRRDGTITQYVSCDDRAWHAGNSCWRGREQCNDDSIGIELEGLEGTPFADAQYPALARLAQAVAAHYPLRHVAGHEHIAPGRKFDPGAAFDWPRLQHLTHWPRDWFPPSLHGLRD